MVVVVDTIILSDSHERKYSRVVHVTLWWGVVCFKPQAGEMFAGMNHGGPVLFRITDIIRMATETLLSMDNHQRPA